MPSNTLLSIPNELIVKIYKFLPYCEIYPLQDSKSFRLTCKRIEEALFPEFGKLFKNKTFMVTQYSLDALVNISQCQFAPFVEEVTILAAEFTMSRTTRARLANGGRASKLWMEKSADGATRVNQAALLQSGRDLALLSKAFGCLASLHDVQVDSSHDGLGAWGFGRDGNTIEVHDVPLRDNGSGSFMTTCITNVLRALAMSSAGASRPHGHRVKTLGITAEHVPDRAFEIAPNLQSQIAPVLSAVEDLVLEVYNCVPLPSTDHFRRFLAYLDGLQSLRLWSAFDDTRDKRKVPGEVIQRESFLEWLAAPVPVPQNQQIPPLLDAASPSPMHFAHLRRLEIGCFDKGYYGADDDFTRIQPQTLLSLITKFKATLRVLSLLVILEDEVDYDTKGSPPNLWKSFLLSLGSSGVCLESLKIKGPSQIVHSVRGDNWPGRKTKIEECGVSFGPLGESSEERSEEVTHEGPDTMDVIRDLAGKAIVLPDEYYGDSSDYEEYEEYGSDEDYDDDHSDYEEYDEGDINEYLDGEYLDGDYGDHEDLMGFNLMARR